MAELLIKSLHLRNVRSVSSLDIELRSPLVVLTGRNGSGKTSIASDALRYLATGAGRGVDQGGRGLERLIYQGRNTLCVAADVRGLGAVKRGRGRDRFVKRRTEGLDPWTYTDFLSGADLLLGRLEVSERVFDLAVSPAAFLAIHGRDRCKVLFPLAGIADLTEAAILEATRACLGGSLEAATVLEFLKAYLDRADGTPEGYFRIREAAAKARLGAERKRETAVGAYEKACETTASYAQDAHQRAIAERDKAQAALDEAKRKHTEERAAHAAARKQEEDGLTRLREERSRVAALIVGESVETLKAELAGLEAERAEAAEACEGRSVSEVTDAIRAVAAPNRSIEELEAEVEAARQKEREGASRRQTVVAELEGLTADDQGSVDADTATLEEAGVAFARMTDLLRGAIQSGNQTLCATCLQPIDRTEAERQLAELRSRLEEVKGRRQAREERSAREARLKAERDRLDPRGLAEATERAEETLAKARQVAGLAPALTAARRVAEIDKRIAELTGQIGAAADDGARASELNRLDADIRAAEARVGEFGTFDSTEHDARVRDLTDSLGVAQAEVTKHETAARERTKLGNLLREAEEATAQHGALNRLVGLLDREVKAALFGEQLQALSSEIDSAMRFVAHRQGVDGPSLGAEIVLIEEGQRQGHLDILLTDARTGRTVPYECASMSEQARLRWALQWIAGKRAGVMVLDDLELLDHECAEAPLLFARAAIERDVQVFLCAASDPTRLWPADAQVIDLDAVGVSYVEGDGEVVAAQEMAGTEAAQGVAV